MDCFPWIRLICGAGQDIGCVGLIVPVDSFFLESSRIFMMEMDNDSTVSVLFAKLARMEWIKDSSGFVFFCHAG